MNIAFFWALALVFQPLVAEEKVHKLSCTFKGRALYGKVQFVTSFPDFKVKVVTAFPDLRVQKVTAFPTSCGKWQEVTAFPDFRIQLVDSFPDFTIQYVEAFPGVP